MECSCFLAWRRSASLNRGKGAPCCDQQNDERWCQESSAEEENCERRRTPQRKPTLTHRKQEALPDALLEAARKHGEQDKLVTTLAPKAVRWHFPISSASCVADIRVPSTLALAICSSAADCEAANLHSSHPSSCVHAEEQRACR